MGGFLDNVGEVLRGLSGEGSRPCSANLLYAVGDIHGRRDLLEGLFEQILEDAVAEAERHGVTRPPIVFLGDLIDRGPDTQGTLEFLLAIRDWPEIAPIFVTGNHERMLMDFLEDPMTHRRWLHFGGYETLVSYGLDRILVDLDDRDELEQVARALSEAMGPHLEVLYDGTSYYEDGNLAFVHAGADPDLPVSAQPHEKLIWGCDAFERRRRRDGVWVVHGHTIVDMPMIRRGRIPLDTGAYITGVLTALKARGTELSFLTETGLLNVNAD